MNKYKHGFVLFAHFCSCNNCSYSELWVFRLRVYVYTPPVCLMLTKTKRGLLAPGMSCERHAGPQYQVIRRMSSWGDRSPELEQVWQFREEVRGARMLAMGL